MHAVIDALAVVFNAIDQFCRTYLWFLIEQNTWTFLFLTVILGGGAAFMAGRSLARSWRSPVRLFIYMLGFTAGIRFLHFALFEATLTSLLYYISHGVIIEGLAWLGYRTTLASQMAAKYPWAFERTSPLSWRAKP